MSFCIFYTSLYSQFTLTHDKFLPVGSSWIQKPILSFNVIDTTIQGSNATWNFAALQATTAAATTITIVNPAQTPYASTFPNATYCYMESPVIAYRYFSLTPTTFERIGSGTTSVVKTYSDSQTELTFPFTLGSANNDTWQNSASSFGGTYDFICIGSGTLVLPTATYNHVLMARILAHESFLNINCYYWYNADNGAVLLYYIVGDGLFIANQGAFIQSLTVGIDETSAFKDFSYTNPVTDLLTLNYNSIQENDVEYSLLNTLGEVVYSQRKNMGMNEFVTTDINTTNLKAGLYVLTIQSNKTGKMLKTAKVIKM